MKWLGLMLRPLDTLFFRDGRPFGESMRGVSGLPNPQTLAGALRTALLASGDFNFQQFADKLKDGADVRTALGDAPKWIVNARFRGPWLARFEKNNGGPARVEPLLPTPQTLVRDDTWHRIDPIERKLPGWSPPAKDMWPLWLQGAPDAKYPGGFLLPEGLKRFLAGNTPTNDHWLATDSLYDLDSRTGIGVNPDSLTAEDGLIYSTSMLALKDNVCFYAEILPGAEPEPPADLLSLLAKPIPFGGEGRAVIPSPVEPFDWDHIQTRNSPRSMWLLATPGVFGDQKGQDCWRPDRIPNGVLKAAASGNPIAFSGWDIARKGPKPTRFAVPAGSVYFVDGDLTTENGSLCGDPEDVAQGWGYALRGVWK